VEGKAEVWSGSIQPHDVWLIKGGFRLKVCFNRYYQSIRKGGAILVAFVVDIAKKSKLCPIGVVNWRNVNKHVLSDIVELICGKFIIPDGKIYIDAMLKHAARYFNSTVRTRQQIENDNLGGIVRGTRLKLVNYWYSGQSKKYADNGREAHAMLSHLHTNGSTSFANSRDEFNSQKDGVYPENTNTQELIQDMAKSKIDASVASSFSSKPRIEVEDENELMYDKDNSN
ncbi:hemagglutinin, partial [Bienertia sinuspersici]